MEKTHPLNLCHVNKTSAIFNRLHTLLLTLALIFLFYYRIYFLYHNSENKKIPTLPYFIVTFAELVLSFIWLLSQAFLWRPVSRTVFPERLPEDDQLPAIDVFVCTADPEKEPTVEVMNTVISAMAMDYPPEKLFVYLSDDGASPVTLRAMHEALSFAKCWIPFCKNYGIKTRCPEVYFGEDQDGNINGDITITTDFIADKKRVEENYDKFKNLIHMIKGQANPVNKRDHSTFIEVIKDKSIDEKYSTTMPSLIYVSREKRTSYPHHFKAGALNVLLRVSGLISNSPYVLVLDCDMYCNDPTSARQAMCFHLDPNLSPSLAFVQFPQKFRNVCENDIYDSQIRNVFTTHWHGMDGIQGPCLSGTGFYMKRLALYGKPEKGNDEIADLKRSFGYSNEFIKSLGQHYIPNIEELKEAEAVASCAYEDQTQWGEEVGFMYFSVVEDFFTDLKNVHGKGWVSVYCDPKRPAFLGASTTNLDTKLVQGTRWMAGLFQVCVSKFSPIIYGPKRMSLLQSMCYAWIAYYPLYFLPLWCLATIPQLCLLSGIPLYPEVSDRFFIVFPFIFLASNVKQIEEIISSGTTNYVQTWINETRTWMMNGVSSQTFGCLDTIREKLGFGVVSFLPTNKVVDDEESKLYQMGMFDFQISPTLLSPMVSLVILNIASVIGGIIRAVLVGNFNEMLLQICLSFFILVVNFPIIEGMVMRKDKGGLNSRDVHREYTHVLVPLRACQGSRHHQLKILICNPKRGSRILKKSFSESMIICHEQQHQLLKRFQPTTPEALLLPH